MLYWGLLVVALYFAVALSTGIRRIIWVAAVTTIFGYIPVKSYSQLLPWHRAQIYFADKCANVAGIKIYKTVSGVDGLVLLKGRSVPTEENYRDRMWPSAAFQNEHGGDAYIESFLGDEHASGHQDGTPGVITHQYRGYINTDRRATGRPGYRFVDVTDEKEGKRYRYVLVQKPRLTSKIGWIDTVLDKTTAPDLAPRYGVTYEEYVVPEERELWIAGGKVSVVDLSTNEVLAEMIQYKHSWGGIRPWLRGPICPGFGGTSDGYTRKFVDQVLIPAGR